MCRKRISARCARFECLEPREVLDTGGIDAPVIGLSAPVVSQPRDPPSLQATSSTLFVDDDASGASTGEDW